MKEEDKKDQDLYVDGDLDLSKVEESINLLEKRIKELEKTVGRFTEHEAEQLRRHAQICAYPSRLYKINLINLTEDEEKEEQNPGLSEVMEEINAFEKSMEEQLSIFERKIKKRINSLEETVD